MSAAKKIKKDEKKGIEEGSSPSYVPLAEIIISLRFKALYIILKSTAWLIIGILFHATCILSIIKPGIIPSYEYLTYGRLQTASFIALIYGFLIQGLSGALIYCSSKTNNSPIKNNFSFYLGYLLWNFGVFIGVVAVLLGDNSGYVYFEMPHYSVLILLISSLFILFNLIVKNESYNPANVFSVGFSVSLILCLAIAYFFLIRFPIVGAGQLLIHTWIKSALLNICITSGILGLIYYSLSKAKISFSIVTFAFIVLSALGGAGGISPSMPVPRWIFELNRSLTFLILIPIFVFVAYALFLLRRADNIDKSSQTDVKPMFFALSCVFLYFLLNTAESLTTVSQMTEFTVFAHGRDLFLFIGAGVPVLFSISRVIIREIAEYEISSNFNKYLYISFISGMIIPAAYIIAGFLQGSRIFDYRILFPDVITIILPFYYLIFFSLTILLTSTLLFFYICNAQYFRILSEKVSHVRKIYFRENEHTNPS